MDETATTRRTRRVHVAIAALWTLAILALCTIPGNEIPDVRIVGIDKIGHFAMFAAFGWLWMIALRIEVRARVRWVLAAGIGYAVMTEVYQGILPFGREPDVWDAVANSAGLLSGIALWHLSFRLVTSVRNTGR